MSEKIKQAKALLGGMLQNFMSESQRKVLSSCLKGEEADGLADVIIKTADRIKACPKTYETEDVESNDKVAHLHYFKGSVDAWIFERDVGDMPEGDGLGEQIQAYGKITLYGEGFNGAEWGYICIAELIDNGVELDLYWEPTTVANLSKG